MYTMGIDIGSASSKVVILKDGKDIVAAETVQVGTGSSGPKRALNSALFKGGLTLGDMARIVATGYGRFAFEEAHKQVTEIRCQAIGNFFLIPTARTIIDIGGQDAKAIRLDDKGYVKQFFMNDKCAAGTGRFLDVMSRVLEVGLTEMAEYDAKATEPATVSSTCTVFAESEVISQLSQGVALENIIAGIHQSIASKAAGLAGRGVVEDDVVMCGGVAQNGGVVRALIRELNRKVIVTPNPQITAALGAAIHAYQDMEN
ncbi:acyl-CoA dehydratase activase [Desulfitobacterium chlororespirans]|uniref:CoA-substrate-specific enzyme activase, putative n=1 Tax=Desulfitobacterium chlororespirans DSM 11544 TaxID=1121395 RepID=A0A1M7UFS6_9FIRM|nr:acyl-CoA dehydratase activase [Desulfitobacterium chlororespirans]SHN81891.1 CoA-substrate-specific enzyme activase, putative [Desulfitobacterium chlororespirans DSM 11544]